MSEELQRLLENRIARYRTKDRLNYFAVYAMLTIAVLSSAAATFIVASGGRRDVAAVLAALPGVVVLATNTFRFEQRAVWYWRRRLLLERLLRSLQFEGKTAAEVSRLWSEVAEETFADWPRFGSVPGSGDHNSTPNEAVEGRR
jgi:hypothetical protein